ncbi:MAG: hypothetical protein JO257_35870 [Deltaproteobacteria bacterium]|nr:hypothetical protein [Deltaproteobacteria bacterium]
MTRVVALLTLVAACDGVFGLNTVPLAADGTGSGSASAYTFVQVKSQFAMMGDSSLMIPLLTVPRAGSLLVVAVGSFQNLPTAVVDSAGNNYTMVPANPQSQGGSHVALFYASQIHTRAPFTITVTTSDKSTGNQLTVIVHEYAGPFAADALDFQSSATGATLVGQTVDSDCGPTTTTTDTVMVAALTRDFNGGVTATPSWRLRASMDMDHTKYAVLATQDHIAPAELADPVFSSTHDADGTSWACLWATFR